MVDKITLKRFQHAFVTKDVEIGETTTDANGVVEIEGLEESGFGIIVPAEDPGAGLVFSDVEIAKDRFTVYTKSTSTDARAVLASKKIFYMVFKK